MFSEHIGENWECVFGGWFENDVNACVVDAVNDVRVAVVMLCAFII